MAGGFGTRLGELTRELPKPMLRVGKKNMLENLIDIFSDHGFRRFYISVHYKSEVIKNYFGNGQSLGVEIQYLEEDTPLGTAGCLGLINERPSEPIFVINGDILTAVNFEELLDFHVQSGAEGTMCVKKYDIQIPYGVVKTSGREILSLSEKPVHSFYVNSGIYVLAPNIIDLVPKGETFNMPTLFEEMIRQKKKTVSYELVDYWADVGLPKDLEQAQKDLSIT
jgi:NDP-sugar pyrophosphorylase family protein